MVNISGGRRFLIFDRSKDIVVVKLFEQKMHFLMKSVCFFVVILLLFGKCERECGVNVPCENIQSKFIQAHNLEKVLPKIVD